MIDDNAEPDQCFTDEEIKLLEHINFNIELWVAEEENIAAAAEVAAVEKEGSN